MTSLVGMNAHLDGLEIKVFLSFVLLPMAIFKTSFLLVSPSVNYIYGVVAPDLLIFFFILIDGL